MQGMGGGPRVSVGMFDDRTGGLNAVEAFRTPWGGEAVPVAPDQSWAGVAW